jgi:hypothetical protein
MNDPCPVCGLLFEREEGYFFGALYASYGLSSVILATLYFIAAYLFPGWDPTAHAGVAFLVYLPLVPAVFRYSRVLWIYYDRTLDPDGALAGPYERMRLKQLASLKGGQAGSQPTDHQA